MLGEERPRIGAPRELGVVAEHAQSFCHRRQPDRLRLQLAKTRGELGAALGRRQVIRNRLDRAIGELDRAARVAAGREQQLSPAEGRVPLVGVEGEAEPCQIRQRRPQVRTRVEPLELLQRRPHGASLRDTREPASSRHRLPRCPYGR